ncbi:MAG TPA: ATP-binding protein [Caulobacterales bacterium]|nr:ATP-binding protein [Caulobacterales bacterium]
MPAAEPQGSSWLSADRLVMIAAALLVACVAMLAIGVFGLAQLQERSAQEGARTRALRAETYALTQAAADAESNERAFLLTNDARYPRAYADSVASMRDHIARMRALTAHDAQLEPAVERVATLSVRAIETTGQVIAPRRSRSQSLTFEASNAIDALRDEIAPLLSQIENRANEIRDRNTRTRATLYWMSVVLILLSLFSAGVAFWAIRAERRSWRAALALMVQANAEAELSRAKSAASDTAKTRFLAAASHDMRQPLHALTLYLSALQRRIEGEEARNILAKAERATHSMVGMFNTLLDLARIQADVVKPENEVFALQEVIDRVLGEHPGANLTGPSPPTLIKANTDPVLLERLLRNLVSNALRHGGGAARIEVLPRGERALITVRDNGPGIPVEEQERIFEEFVRLDGRAGAEGLGLGLAIVKRIADLLGATLELRSTPGQGAAFTVGVVLAGIGHIAPPTASNMHEGEIDAAILVMDDDPLALEAEMSVLRDLGAEVRGCVNEAEVTAAIESGFKPRLLVMDLRIDGVLAGVDIAHRAQARLQPPPRVLMVTGDTAPETLAQLRASGHDWLIKPVSRDDLATAVLSARTESVVRD